MNLPSELKAASERVQQRHINRLAGLGVSGEEIGSLCHWDTHLAVVEAEEVEGLYCPVEAAPLHFLTPVRVGGELIDLCVWRPVQPDKWLLRTGAGWCLGEDHIIGNWDSGLFLHATPLDWIKSGGCGACVLDWASPEVRQLANLETVRVSDPALGRALVVALSRPSRLPRIIEQEARLAA